MWIQSLQTHQILMSSIKLSSIPVMYFVMNNGGSGKEMLSVWALFTFLWCTVRLFYMHFLIGLSLIDYFKNVILRLILEILLKLERRILKSSVIFTNLLIMLGTVKLVIQVLLLKTSYRK